MGYLLSLQTLQQKHSERDELDGLLISSLSFSTCVSSTSQAICN